MSTRRPALIFAVACVGYSRLPAKYILLSYELTELAENLDAPVAWIEKSSIVTLFTLLLLLVKMLLGIYLHTFWLVYLLAV